MTTNIHPTACIDPGAVVGEGAEIGPYVVVGPDVRIGARAKLLPHCHIVARTTIGDDCYICSSAVVGGDPQDLKFKGEDTDLIIGNRTRIGEFATINRGTGVGGGKTVIGSNCLIMAYVHIAHDCMVGDNVVITNNTQLAGHIKIEDHAWLSGGCLLHHFTTVGSMSFVAPWSGVGFDVPPYMIIEGVRQNAKVRGLNVEGMRRRSVPEESLTALRKAFKIVYRRSDTMEDAIANLGDSDVAADPYVANLLEHLKASHAGVGGRALERYRTDKTRALPKRTEPEDDE